MTEVGVLFFSTLTPEFDINISAIYVKFGTPPKCSDLLFIS
jgi:hypothetical protein